MIRLFCSPASGAAQEDLAFHGFLARRLDFVKHQQPIRSTDGWLAALDGEFPRF